MRRGLLILAGLVALIIIGGGLTSQLLTEVPIIVQSENPDASVFQATPEQANQFIIWIVFVLVNVVGAGLTLALIFWFGNKQVATARSMPNANPSDENVLESDRTSHP